MSVVVRSMMLALVALTPLYAAEQLVPTKTLLVKNPPSGARKILYKVSEPGSAATLVGDPTTDGATLRVVLTPGGDQCVAMPSTGWTAISSMGFKYKDPTLANGPVKVAQIKKTPSGMFQVKAILKNGGPTSITIVPGNQTTSHATKFTLGVGDDYCGGTATATPNPNDAATFKVKNDGAPAGCVASCNATTTSTSSTTTFTITPNVSTTTSTSVTTTFTGILTTTSTSLPSSQVCCPGGYAGLPDGACTYAVPSVSTCLTDEFAGYSCDGATGGCVTTAANAGNCCENSSGLPCIAGPAITEEFCTGIGPTYTFVPGSRCSPAGTCVP